MENEKNIRCSVLTKVVYVISLIIVMIHYISSMYGHLNTFYRPITLSSIFKVFTSYDLMLYLLVILFLAWRIYLIVSKRVSLDSPVRKDMSTLLRGAGLFILYVCTVGWLLITTILIISKAPGIFSIFTSYFKVSIPYGLILFEAGRLFAFELTRPNQQLQATQKPRA